MAANVKKIIPGRAPGFDAASRIRSSYTMGWVRGRFLSEIFGEFADVVSS